MFAEQKLTLLYIEDHFEIRQNLSEFLSKNGLTVYEGEDLATARKIFQNKKIDILMLDLHLHHENGMDFVRYLREQQIQIPVIITTAYTDKSFLLDSITYDVTRYLVKPFKKSDLLEAIQIASKRLVHYKVNTLTMLHHGYRYDPDNKTVTTPAGEVIQLSKKEHLLLELLLSQRNQLVTYDTIETVVWKTSPMSIDALRTLIRGMRKKLYQDVITNLNGMGYKIEA